VDLILSDCAGFFAANTYELGARKYGKYLKKVLTNSNCYYNVVVTKTIKRGVKLLIKRSLKPFCCAILPGG
jgi:hypothetical protein